VAMTKTGDRAKCASFNQVLIRETMPSADVGDRRTGNTDRGHGPNPSRPCQDSKTNLAPGSARLPENGAREVVETVATR